MKKIFFLLYFLCVTIYLVNARTFYVAAGSGSDSNNGYSWATAKQTISSAISAASSGDSVFVSIGQYDGFRTAEGIHIFGGFVGVETYLYERQTLNYGYLSNTLCTQINSWIYNLDSYQANASRTTINGLVIKTTDNGGVYIQKHKTDISNCYISALWCVSKWWNYFELQDRK